MLKSAATPLLSQSHHILPRCVHLFHQSHNPFLSLFVLFLLTLILIFLSFAIFKFSFWVPSLFFSSWSFFVHWSEAGVQHASLTVECENVTNSATGPPYPLIICRKYWSSRLNQCGMLQHGLPQLNELKPVRLAARNNASSIKHASAFPWHLPSFLQRSLCVCACVRAKRDSRATFLNTPVHWTRCCSSNAIDLYLTGIWFESRQGYLLFLFSWLLVVLEGWRRLSSSYRLPSVRLRSLPGFQLPFTHGAV